MMNIVSKTKNAIAPELTRILYSEIAALGQIGELQKNIEKAVYEKQWTDFDAAAHCLAEHRTALEALEAERMSLLGCTAAQETAEDFYLWTAELAPVERDSVMDAYRALKKMTARVKTANEAFAVYLQQMQLVVSGFLDAAFPERRTAVYGREGAVRSSDMRCVVLDKQF